MSAQPLPTPDNLPIRSFGPWAQEKLHYLQEYITRFTVAMHNKPWRSRRYIDLFAGTGKVQINHSQTILGSPLLALNAPHPFTEYIFADSKEGNLNILQQHCTATNKSANIHYHCGDSNVYVQQLVAQIKAEDDTYIPQVWSSLNLAFLDPDGLELEWSTVAALATVKKMDLIIHYSQGGLNRNFGNCFNRDKETVIDRFFGDTEWKNIYRRHKITGNQLGLHRELMDYYKSKLQSLGYVDIKNENETGIEPLMRNTKQAPLYRLIFASKNKLGHQFWKSATRKTPSGQKRLF